jgi:hypothetical protein
MYDDIRAMYIEAGWLDENGAPVHGSRDTREYLRGSNGAPTASAA